MTGEEAAGRGPLLGADLPPEPAAVARNVAVAPYETPWKGGPDPSLIPAHGRVTRGPEWTPVDGFRKIWRTAAKANPLRGAFLYGGPYFNHFGHVMVDSIARLWAYDPAIHRDGVVFPNVARNRSAAPAGYFQDILSGFGIGPEAIRIVAQPCVVKELHFPQPGSNSVGGPAGWYLRKLESVEKRLLERATPGLRTHERIYLGRVHIRRRGSLMGESFFSELLQGQGYVYVKPEDHSVFDQVRLMKEARRIVFMEGSAVHITELMPSLAAKVCMLLRRQKGETLFVPHLAPRCDFSVAGLGTQITRQAGRTGLHEPASPSYVTDPRAMLADLVRAGMIEEEPFGWEAYRAKESADAFAYFADDRPTAESQLSAVERLRGDAGLGAGGFRGWLRRLL